MAKRSKKGAKNQRKAKDGDLPASREVGARLLAVVSRFLDEHAAYRQRQVLRLKNLRDGIERPERVLANASLMKELRRGTDQQAAQGVARLEELFPYLNSKRLARLATSAQQARVRYKEACQRPKASAATISALDAVIQADDAVAAELERFQRSLVEKLEGISADTRADTGSGNPVLPRNDDITRLYCLLERNRGVDKRSELQVALEFTNGNEKRAKSLLRGARRMKKRVRGANSG